MKLIFASTLLVIISTCGGSVSTQDNALATKDALVTLESIDVQPTNPSIARDTVQQFTATGIFSDGSTQDLTTTATWSSTSSGVATLDNTTGSKGLASAVSAGTTTITTTWEGIAGSTMLIVTPATLVSSAITPTSSIIAKGTSLQFNAIGAFSDNSKQDLTAIAIWSSTSPGVATVNNTTGSKGLASAVSTGTTTITAIWGGIPATTTLTITPATLVSSAITPIKPNIAKGTALQFTATGTFSDNSKQNLTALATWSSTSSGVAVISDTTGSKGLASAVSTGTTTITAIWGSIPATTTLTITPATLVSTAITPTSPRVAKGTTQQFTATGTFTDSSKQDLTALATWSSSSSGVAVVSNATGFRGLATTASPGATTIKAIWGGISGTTLLTVTASSLSWNAPTAYTDGTQVLNLATEISGYKLYYGTTSLTYTQTIPVANPGTVSVSYPLGQLGLPPGMYYFVVTAVDATGIESDYSNEVPAPL